MKYFTTVNDVADANDLVHEALQWKHSPFASPDIGRNKVLGLIFFNASLRTRMSTQRAAMNLGMTCMVMNIGNEGWALEFHDGAVMNGKTVEHIRDAAAVMGLYCDIIGVRCFPTLIDKQADYSESVLLQFMKYSRAPLISLESATLHPLQSLADIMTIRECVDVKQPKVVLTWAPHMKPLPQVVANSFAEWALHCDYKLTITQPAGYELCEDFTRGADIEYDQEKALKDADVVYVKNWSAYNAYGDMPSVEQNWMLNDEKMKLTSQAKLMHCMPVRRNLEVPDALLDNAYSLIMKQAENRIYAAQAVLFRMLQTI
ncbi:MAG: acetylornithine carbamoyltransferase [Bacteroidetes bacterium]|nr:acetylornithine carbamoyltransferase [Bacteroidota bacterium]